MTHGAVLCSAWLGVAVVLMALKKSMEVSSGRLHWDRFRRDLGLLRVELFGLVLVVSKLFVLLVCRLKRRGKTVYLLGKCLVLRVRINHEVSLAVHLSCRDHTYLDLFRRAVRTFGYPPP